MRAALLLAITVVIGIASRRVHVGVPLWDKSVGDVLYAVAVTLVIALLRPRDAPMVRALVAFAICFAIELFQLTGIPIALAARAPWVHWVLGAAFGWHDVVCYAIGVAGVTAIVGRG
jgi:hypothetical protein